MRPIVYPRAKWELLENHSRTGVIGQRSLIVLHITEGPTARSAIETFRNSVAPHRVSAHFVIDRDGTVYQLVDINDTAWHASQCNNWSVGIEHAAISEQLYATEAQIDASARLIAWLCPLMYLPCDRLHVKTHFEASPADGHVKCCTGALNPDAVVDLAKLYDRNGTRLGTWAENV